MPPRLTVNDDTSPLGIRMTERMRQLRLSDEDVAAETGLHKDTIRAYRRLADPRPTAKNASLVSKALKCSTEYLLHGTGEVPAGGDVVPETASIALANKLREQLRAVYAELNGWPIERIDIRVELR